MRWLIGVAVHGTWAYQQAVICTANYVVFGFPVGLLTLFFCMLANHLVAAWVKGDFH